MKDIIFVEHKNFLSIKDDSICFKNSITKAEKYIPFSSIEAIVFENIDSYFSNKVINLCAKEQIQMIFCDEFYSPVATINSEVFHNRKIERLNLQLNLRQKSKNRMWKKIITSKISNQADCLLNLKKNKQTYNKLIKISKNVKEGDKDNREAYAANIYFDNLIGKNFKRGRYKDIYNSSLNYGYAIINSIIKKELIIHGLEMSVGIFHNSNENPFNLVYDLIEAYRPFLDYMVVKNIFDNKVKNFTSEERRKIVNIILKKCIIDDKIYTICDAIKLTINSYIQCIENNSASNLKLPCFIDEL